MVPPSGPRLFNILDSFLVVFIGLQKDFDQWDPLVEGDDENLIPGSPFDAVTQVPAQQHSPGSQTQN